MPKIITTAMRAHLDAETTRLAAIWRITRKDGAQFFFTDHDRDIVFGGDTYRADAGFARTAIRSDAGFAVDNLDLVGVFAEGGIVEDEVRAGLFDGAEIRVSFVNWEDPDGHGEIRLRRGTLGETRLTPQVYFHAELRGLSQPLAQSTLEVFSPNCRADLGDHRCKFPIEPPELGRDQAVSEGAFYRVSTAAGTGSARYEDRIYEVIEAGTTASSQPAYDTTIGATTTDGTATLCFASSWTPAMVRRWHADRSASCAHGTSCLRSWGVRHPPRPRRPARAWSPSSWGSELSRVCRHDRLDQDRAGVAASVAAIFGT
jgi:hypothetical protein